MDKIEILENEYWWAGCIKHGHTMPYSRDTKDGSIDMYGDFNTDQFSPLLVSSLGRYYWNEEAFKGTVNDGVITLETSADGELHEGYENLRGAYLAAMKAHFPFTGAMPDKSFFTGPQYNTWIELSVDQCQDGIIKFAEDIIANGFTPGVLMIDGGWQEDYGVYDYFNERKVPHPKEMVDRLHELGFKVMLWVSPIVSLAGWRYKELRDKRYLCMRADGKQPAIREWWSGYCSVMDLTNPGCCEWFHGVLDHMIKDYGVDGFKFDAGDLSFYSDDDKIFKPMSAREQTKAFVEFGEKYPFNEFRAAWKCGGHPIIARLHDKSHSWTQYGINTLIPHTILQGLAGYPYCCPDMVGGGGGGGVPGTLDNGVEFDQELYVRWIQSNALTAMMQISIAPWRVLSEENYKIARDCIELHEKYGETFYELGVNASKTGEPIIRHLCYEFPGQGFETINDQFMLGSDVLVAPVIIKGQRTRDVVLPAGCKWISDEGKEYDGGQTITENVPLSRLAYYTRVK